MTLTVHTLEVNTLRDENDGGNGGTGLSLRDAILMANLDPLNHYVINLGFGTYNLSLNGSYEENGETGDLDIKNSNITINGIANSGTIISANGLEDRIFDVSQFIFENFENRVYGSKLTLNNVTLTGGTAAPSNDGGAILINSGNSVTINNSILTDNESSLTGGAIFNDGELNIFNSNLNNNSAVDGGAIINYFGTANIIKTAFRNNTAANGAGGAIFNEFAGTLNITDSHFVKNTANLGGGVNNAGELTITNSTLEQNTANASGGGVFNFNQATITNSTFSGNEAVGFVGGGITNTRTLKLYNSTVAKNSAKGAGGGVYNNAGGTATLNSTIVADNLAKLANNLVNNDVQGNFTNSTFNLIGTSTGATGFNSGVGSNIIQVTVLPNLTGGSGNNRTHNITEIFNAINKGSNPLTLTTDQRGFPRSVGQTDIGAYEAGNESPIKRGVLSFGSAQYTVNEAINFAQITVIRTGGSTGSVSASLSFGIPGDTATLGSDYNTVLPTTVTFADGEVTRTLQIPIINTPLVEPSEKFTITLTNLTADLTGGATSQTKVTILDDDKPLPNGCGDGYSVWDPHIKTFDNLYYSLPTQEIYI
jgi:hypothetical protein